MTTHSADTSDDAHKTRTNALALAALGIVYGDIGTSPLYALKETFGSPHHPVPLTPDNVLGILSLVFWALMMIVTCKYVLFIMRADNKGEGGIMALMALALRKTEKGSRKRSLTITLGLIGAALFYGDGVITPAISVLSAVEGLSIIAPALESYVIPCALAVLIGLFIIQRHGTASVGRLFGPIMLLWFATLATLGGLGIADNPEVLRAINPAWGFNFLVHNPALGFFSLGSVVLVVTGGEALYADMGHFGLKPVQRAWLALVLPALLTNYFGQGALLLANPDAVSNPFYLLAPSWALTPLVVLATIATVIASQAVISGAFSLTHQAIQLGYSPRMQVQHTSASEMGQIYLRGINWVLLAAVIALVVGFRSSSNLAAAYGIAVTGTMLITNLLAFVVMRESWAWPLWRAVLCLIPFVCIDFAFFASNATKILDGGWFPIAFGVGIFILLDSWKRGSDRLRELLSKDAFDLKMFIESLALGGATRVPGTAIFMTSRPNAVPRALLHSLKHYKAIHDRMVVVSVEIFDVPYVPDIDRVEVCDLGENFWQVNVHYGFKEEPDIPAALDCCAHFGMTFDEMDTSYFLGRATLVRAPDSPMPRWRAALYAVMFRNATTATAFFKIPANRVVELGTQVAI